jgi:hypothetical protein
MKEILLVASEGMLAIVCTISIIALLYVVGG